MFIGRQSELAVMTAALDDALAGRGQMVMLAGEPGIGKTRLAQELAGLAEQRGARVLWGWCFWGGAVIESSVVYKEHQTESEVYPINWTARARIERISRRSPAI